MRILIIFFSILVATSALKYHVQLMGGQTSRDGVVHVLDFFGREGPICGPFDDVAAGVVCRQLKFKTGMSLLGPGYPLRTTGTTPHMMRDVRCQGTEKTLDQCQFTIAQPLDKQPRQGNVDLCDYLGMYAYVICRGQEDQEPEESFNISLTSMEEAVKNHGTVSLTFDGVKGAICGDGWNKEAAETACRHLGYSSGYNYTVLLFDQDTGPIITGNVSCPSGADNLSQCKYAPFGSVTACDSGTVAEVSCVTEDSPKLFRFADTSATSGAVQAYVNGRWGNVCRDGPTWDVQDVTVLCRTLGYKSGTHLTNQEPSLVGYSEPMWSYDPFCTGDESNLMDCQRSVGFVEGCFIEIDVLAVSCDTSETIPPNDKVSVKLVNGQKYRDGIVMTLTDKKFAPVCHRTTGNLVGGPNEHFTDVEAVVVCRERGLSGGHSLWGLPYGVVPIPSVLSREFRCKGDEKSLAECNHTEFKAESSTYNTDCYDYAAVVCRRSSVAPPEAFNVTIRMENELDFYGSVQLTYDGIAGSICADDWSRGAANLVCRHLQYSGGLNYSQGITSASFHGPMWTSNVSCNDSSEKLQDCPHAPFGTVDRCDTVAMAQVLCYHENEYPSFRFGDGNGTSGTVQMSLNGTWLDVCADYPIQGSEGANVMCRTLGFTHGHLLDRDDMPAVDGDSWSFGAACDASSDNVTDIMDCNVYYLDLNREPAVDVNSPHCVSGKVLTVSCFGAEAEVTDHTGEIVGGVVGGVTLLCIVGFGAVFIRKKMKHPEKGWLELLRLTVREAGPETRLL